MPFRHSYRAGADVKASSSLTIARPFAGCTGRLLSGSAASRAAIWTAENSMGAVITNQLTCSEQGCGLMLLGDSDTTHTILKADGKQTSLKLRNDEATQRVFTP